MGHVHVIEMSYHLMSHYITNDNHSSSQLHEFN